MNIDVKKQFLNNIPEFYKKCFDQLDKNRWWSISSPLTFSNVRKQILWANIFITLENKYLLLKNGLIVEYFLMML